MKTEHQILCSFGLLEEIKKELENKYESYKKLNNISLRKPFFNVVYHKISVNEFKNKDLPIYEGFYEILNSNTKKCYTSFKGLVKYCHSQGFLIKNFKVIEGYTERGKHLKKGGFENE